MKILELSSTIWKLSTSIIVPRTRTTNCTESTEVAFGTTRVCTVQGVHGNCLGTCVEVRDGADTYVKVVPKKMSR